MWSPYSVGGFLIWVVVVCAIVALAQVAIKQFGLNVPPWFMNVLWILAVAFVVIFAIRLLLSM